MSCGFHWFRITCMDRLTFPRYWPFVRGIHRSQRPVTQSLIFSLICAWTNGWANNRDTGDLSRHRVDYDVTVMRGPVIFRETSRYFKCYEMFSYHYSDVIMSTMASQITGVSIVYSTVCSGADQRKHQSSASLAFVRGIHRWLVNSPYKGPVTHKMFTFDDVIMIPLLIMHCRMIFSSACLYTTGIFFSIKDVLRYVYVYESDETSTMKD